MCVWCEARQPNTFCTRHLLKRVQKHDVVAIRTIYIHNVQKTKKREKCHSKWRQREVPSSSFSAARKRAKSPIRHQLQVTFRSESSKSEFLFRLDRAKQRLFPGANSVDNFQLLSDLLDALDGSGSSSSDMRGI